MVALKSKVPPFKPWDLGILPNMVKLKIQSYIAKDVMK